MTVGEASLTGAASDELAVAPDIPLALAMLTTGPGARRLFVARGTRLEVSADDGQTWRPVALPGPAGELISTVAAIPAAEAGDPPEVFAGATGAVYRSADGGETWQRLPVDRGSAVTALARVGVAPGTLLAGTMADGVLRWDEPAGAWRAATAGLIDYTVLALAGHVAAGADGTSPAAVPALLGAGSGAYISETGGWSWRDMPCTGGAAAVTALAVVPDGTDGTAGARLLVGIEGTGVMTSTDAGQTWRTVLPVDDVEEVIAIDPVPGAGPMALAVVTSDRLAFAAAGGEDWTWYPAPATDDLMVAACWLDLAGPRPVLVAGLASGQIVRWPAPWASDTSQ